MRLQFFSGPATDGGSWIQLKVSSEGSTMLIFSKDPDGQSSMRREEPRLVGITKEGDGTGRAPESVRRIPENVVRDKGGPVLTKLAVVDKADTNKRVTGAVGVQGGPLYPDEKWMKLTQRVNITEVYFKLRSEPDPALLNGFDIAGEMWAQRVGIWQYIRIRTQCSVHLDVEIAKGAASYHVNAPRCSPSVTTVRDVNRYVPPQLTCPPHHVDSVK
ncbi:hypothetical protein B0H10DRAFT_1965716 [Mycena sp. CBHHK59/15]|nr:hypothetical protein B0H10DRAFT_1965716 [Mycena sp. CBHHK59/15]